MSTATTTPRRTVTTAAAATPANGEKTALVSQRTALEKEFLQLDPTKYLADCQLALDRAAADGNEIKITTAALALQHAKSGSDPQSTKRTVINAKLADVAKRIAAIDAATQKEHKAHLARQEAVLEKMLADVKKAMTTANRAAYAAHIRTCMVANAHYRTIYELRGKTSGYQPGWVAVDPKFYVAAPIGWGYEVEVIDCTLTENDALIAKIRAETAETVDQID